MNGNNPMQAGDGGGGDIDLGQPQEGMAEMPAGGAVGPPTGPQYPSVMLSGDEALAKIPDSGRAMIHHAVISRRIHKPQHGPHKGKTRHEVEIHIKKIRPMRAYKKAASKSEMNPDEKAMRKAMGDEDAGQ